VKADDKVIYEQTPEYICPGGDIEKDEYYTEKPVIISIPENTKQIELSCSRGRIRLTSVVMERKDGNTVYIPLYFDGYMGTPPVTAVIDKAGNFKSNDPVIDAEKVLNTKNRINSIMETKQLADRYGVGFMVGEVGMYGDHFLNYVVPDKTVFAYFRDILTTLDKYDIPWATGWIIDRYGPLTTYPYYKDRTYQKLKGAEIYYLDKTMFNLFKNIMESSDFK
jgi:trehalose utilization protein